MAKTLKELVQLAAQNDQDAINELYNQSYNGVYRAVKTMIKDEDTALDIVQDSYVKGFQNLDQLKEPEKYSAWMKQIAVNKARDHLKKKRPVLFTEMENEDGEMMEFADDCIDHLPEEMLDREETARLLREILDALPEEQRAAIFMLHYEQMSVKEIAEALGCSENTVKSRLKYGREKVKEKVEALEKKGTKLYSLAPMPYLLWLFRMAKAQSIPASAICPAADAAAGVTAAQAARTVGTRAAEKTAKSASKSAAKTGAKALSRKIVAGTLAVTVAGGAGVAAVNTLRNPQRENAAAHAVYEEFLDRYKVALESDYNVIVDDQDRFWSEVSQDIWEQNPDANPNVSNSWYLDYTPGEDFQKGIPVPDTIFEPNMDKLWLLTYYRLDEQELRYAYFDADADGIDEMFIAMFYRGELEKTRMDVYTVEDQKLIRGGVNFHFYGDHTDWELKPTSEAEYVDRSDIVYINMGDDAFTPPVVIPEPDCEWRTFCSYASSRSGAEEAYTTAPAEETVFRDPELNRKARQVFEDFLEQNRGQCFPNDSDALRFWHDLGDALYDKYGEDPALQNSYEFVYTPGEGYVPDVPLPDTLFKPNMFTWYRASGVWEYVYQDINGDGVDELLVRDSDRSEYVFAYFFLDGKLMHVCIEPGVSAGEPGYWDIAGRYVSSAVSSFWRPDVNFTFIPIVMTATYEAIPNNSRFTVPDSLDWVPLL